MRNFIRFILLSLLITACLELPVNPESNHIISISGILQNRTNTQRLYLFKGSSDTLYADSNKFDIKYNSLEISGAVITLTGSDIIKTYIENDSISGEYFLKGWKPEAGKSYHLKIHHPLFPDVTASTRIPDSDLFNFSYNFFNSGDLHFSWDDLPGSYGYLIWIYQWKDFYDENFNKYYAWGSDYYVLSKSSSQTIKEEYLLHKAKMVDLKIICSAIDKNYYNFLKLKSTKDPFDFRLFEYGNYSTVKNGVGYFGSALVDSIIIYRNH